MLLSESYLIPYQTSPLPKSPWLIFAPHADDETLGMGGTLLLAKQQKLLTNLVIMTDGCQGGKNENLMEIREAEVKEVVGKLGINKTYFLRQSDRQLSLSQSLINQIKKIIEETKPVSIFIPGLLELHPDHRVTANIVWQTIQQISDFQGCLYGYEIATQSPINLLIDISAVIDEKLDIFNLYESQINENNYAEIVKALNKTRSYTLSETVSYAEGFYQYNQDYQLEYSEQASSILNKYWQMPKIKLPLVSVIIRTKDRKIYLKEAIESVNLQTYLDIELVVVNDGGEDVEDIFKEYQERFININYINLKINQGRAKAGNKGLENAQGKYLIFLDDDDLWENNHIENLVKGLIENPTYKAAYTKTKLDFVENKELNRIFKAETEKLWKNNYIPIHSMMFDRIFIDQGCKFDINFEIYEDWDFWLQLSIFTDFLAIDQITAIYRNLGNSDTSTFGGRNEEFSSNYAYKIYQKWNKFKIKMEELEDLINQTQVFNQQILEQSNYINNLETQIQQQKEQEMKQSDRLFQLESAIIKRDNRIENLENKLENLKNQNLQIQQTFSYKFNQLTQNLLDKLLFIPKLIYWLITLQLPKKLREEKIYSTIKKSGMFDQDYYLLTYPDVAEAGIDPLRHYVNYYHEGRNPNPNFDSSYYLQANPDVARAKMHPFFHYLLYGKNEQRPTKPSY